MMHSTKYKNLQSNIEKSHLALRYNFNHVQKSRNRSNEGMKTMKIKSIMKFTFKYLQLQIILTSLKIVIGSESSKPFLKEPNAKPYYVKELEAGPLLQCSIDEKYRDRSRYELEWIKVVRGLPITVSRNSDLFDKKYYNLEEDIKNGEYNLRVKVVALAQDNGNFFCALIDLEDGHRQYHSSPANIIVVVLPDEPKIITQPTEAVYENQLVTLECESKGGNPPPQFAWIFDNNTQVPESWIQHRHAINGVSVSTLRWHVKSEDNGAFLTCQIWNEAMHQAEILSVETRKINVLYVPRITVGPQSPLFIEDGESIELNCQADANPKVTHFEWRHIASGQTLPQAKWRFTAERRLTGEFQCIASNQIGNGVAKLHLNVLYAPKLKIQHNGKDVTHARIEPAEGEELILECEVDALPPADQISWLSPNGAFLHNGSRLVIPHVQRIDVGNFTCLASNSLTPLYSPSLTPSNFNAPPPLQIRTSQIQVEIDVRRKPGPANIGTSGNIVNAGDRIVLNCRTNDFGNPIASYRWETPQGKSVVESQELIIEEAKLDDNGRYKCYAYNDIGSGKEAIARILVIEPARISRLLPKKHSFFANDVDSALHCQAQGFPAPHFEWLKDGIPIADAATSTSTEISVRSRQHWIAKEQEVQNEHNCSSDQDEPCLRSVVGSLAFFDTVQWSDKGNYTCRTYNGATASITNSSSTTTVTVTHEPVIFNERPNGDFALAAADIGSSAEIICLVSANPTPIIIWTRNGHEISGDDEARFSIRTSRLFNKYDEYESILEFSNVAPGDYGAYGCVASNGAGKQKATLEIRLQAKSRPQIPQNARLMKVGPTWLQVGWRPGFDGGEEQRFELQYRMLDAYTMPSILPIVQENDEVTTFIFDSHNSTTAVFYNIDQITSTQSSVEIIRHRRSFGSSDLFASSAMLFYVHNLTRLRPASALWWRVRARNSLGYSDWTAMSLVETTDVTENEAIMTPESVQYFFDEKKLIIQPFKSNMASMFNVKHSQNGIKNASKNLKETTKKIASTLCTLVYITSQANDLRWRSINCFAHQSLDITANNESSKFGSAVVVEGIQPAEKIRVRFCRRTDLSVCSPAAEVSVDMLAISSIAPSWALLFAVGAGVIACVLGCFAILFCCRRLLFPHEFHGSSSVATNVSGISSEKKASNNKKKFMLSGNVSINKYDVSAPMSTNIKNTAIHGSQNDSGIFTLGSSTNALLHSSTNNRQPLDSNHSSLDHSPYDFSNDPYLQEFHNLHGIVAIENGLAANELQEPRTRNRSQQSQIFSNVQAVASSLLLRQSQTQMCARRSASLSSNTALGVQQVNNNHTHLNNVNIAETNNNIANADNETSAIIEDNVDHELGTSSPLSPSINPFGTDVADDSSNSSVNGSFKNNSCRVMREIIV